MKAQFRLVLMALSVPLFILLVSASPSQAAPPQKKSERSAPTHPVKRMVDRDERIGAGLPGTFDQKASDTREQIRERLTTERRQGGSLLGRLRGWLSRPGDIGGTTGQTQGGDARTDDDDEDDEDDDCDDEEEPGENDDDEDEEEEEDDDDDDESPVNCD